MYLANTKYCMNFFQQESLVGRGLIDPVNIPKNNSGIEMIISELNFFKGSKHFGTAST